MPASDPSKSGQRLNSWKEIAAFFSRDERTVNRWEKTLGLPVHRLPGAKGRVYAYTDELSQWRKVPRPAELLVMERQTPLETPELPAPDPGVPTLAEFRSPSGGRKARLWIVLASMAMLVVLVGVIFRLEFQRHSPHLRTQAATSLGASPVPSTAANPEAEQLYLTGRYYWNKRTRQDLEKAVGYFTQASVKDPGYAKPYVGLADCYNLLREYSAMPESEAFPKALAAARKAVELDDTSAEAHTSLAFPTFYWNRDPVTAEREFKRALALDPNYAVAHQWYATFLLTLSRPDEALREIDQAQKLDPSSRSILADRGLILFNYGQPEAAISLLKQLESAEPAFISPHRYLEGIYMLQKDYRNSLAEWKIVAQLVPDAREQVVQRAAELGFAVGGTPGMFQGILRARKQLYEQSRENAYYVAQAYAMVGNRVEAMRYLQIAHDRHEPALINFRVDQSLQILHDMPEFRAMVAESTSTPTG